MIIPHERGAKTVRIKFSKTDDLTPVPMPKIDKTIMQLLEVKKKEESKDAESGDEKTGSPVSVNQIAQQKEAA